MRCTSWLHLSTRNQSYVFLVGILLLLSVTGNCSDEMVLFDGSSLDGWAHTGPGYFKINPAEKSMVAMGGMGMTFFYDRQFADFELTLEWKAKIPETNSGVFIRFPNLPSIHVADESKIGPWAAVHEGYEIQICDSAGLDGTGSLYSFFKAMKNNSKPTGEWNEMKIRAEGQHYQVWMNGEKVGDYTGSRALKGYIGLQNHFVDEEVAFRNIRIKELEPQK